jgi:hypothetical protein
MAFCGTFLKMPQNFFEGGPLRACHSASSPLGAFAPPVVSIAIVFCVILSRRVAVLPSARPKKGRFSIRCMRKRNSKRRRKRKAYKSNGRIYIKNFGRFEK